MKDAIMMRNFRDMIQVTTVELINRIIKRQKINQKARDSSEKKLKIKLKRL